MAHQHGPGQFDPERLFAMEARRRQEMAPEDMLRLALPRGAQAIADVGCGSGFFTIAAARLQPEARVWAVDRQQDMLDFVQRRAEAEGLGNIVTARADATSLPFPDGALDAVLMSNVFHDIPERDAMRDEVQRVLRPDGVFFLLEWEKAETPMGPPLEIRIAAEDLERILAAGGFTVAQIWHGPGSQYRLLARRPPAV